LSFFAQNAITEAKYRQTFKTSVSEKQKVKIPQGKVHKGWPRGVVEVQLYSFMTSAVDGVGGQCHAPAAFIPGKDPIPIVQETERFHKDKHYCSKIRPTEALYTSFKNVDYFVLKLNYL
jgi:pyruvate/2-oxoglutarate/acetoin dehydrogenase E1 component